MTNSDEIEMLCVVCGNPAGLMCQRCGEPYCKDGCQRLDWQRHKHVCIIMPPLVACRPIQHLPNPNPIKTVETAVSKVSLAETPAKIESFIKNPTSTPVVPVKKNEVLSENWRDHLMPKGEEFFECRVTFMEKEGPFWVVLVVDVESMERMTDNMQRCMQNQKLIRSQHVKKNTLVVINVDSKIHRGQVLTVSSENQEADIRMIDYGAVVCTPFRDIYDIVPKIAEFNAFAFRVKLPTNTGVQVNKNLTLRLLGTRTHDGVYHVHLKPKMTIPLSLPMEMLQLNPEVKVIRVFEKNATANESQVALLQINVMDHINKDLNASLAGKPGQPFTGPFPEDKCTFFVAARTKDGYRRAFLLDHIVRPTPTFLVYEMDEGRVSVTSELTRIPSELLGLPIRVFAAHLKDSVPKELETCGADLTVKFKLDNPPPKEKLRAANAALLAKGEQICMARLSTFLGQISELGHKIWSEPIVNDASVFITHVVSFKEVYVSSPSSKQYAGIFKRLEAKCPAFKEASEVSVGCNVLVVSKKIAHFRGEVLSVEDGMYNVVNVDTGANHQLDLTVLRKSCRFLDNMPVSLLRVNLKTVCNIPDTAVPASNAAIHLLHLVSTQEEIFNLKMEDASTSTVDLLSNSGEQRSLVNRMLPLMFTPMQEKEKVAAPTPAPSPVACKQSDPFLMEPAKDLPPLPPSPPDSPAPFHSVDTPELMEGASKKPFERFFFNAMPKYLVPLGDKVNIILLNAGGMTETGYITACFFQNGKVAEEFQRLLNLVAKQGECGHNAVPGYIPNVGELCLAMFSEDKSWYRGICQEVKDNVVKILYCDFGNWEYVSPKNLKPISQDLLEGVYATKCYIDGFDKSKNFAALELYLVHQSKFQCDVKDGPEPDTRLITVPNLENILNQTAA
ncbi:uncharacterized protein LOC108047970 [Drosophila rhopaloa]|uniref:Tudor domain-containing protein 1 n=1 Tax=Drosophila rhopaloa TaxID=1041015 RepID=A0ABM5HQJ4_DRORH|nr:uncharacterized protein LOC108047970 [Drosophila rhopaloa]XP_016983899.2 uncharacterized protein LOC108047970 [Drosophila rhopaloa]XP_044314544.1 uncharacterized protein LOC108047970 [Drosophila rhopaloa]